MTQPYRPLHPLATEIISKRSRHAKHFLRPDGRIDAVFGKFVHYEVSPGVWDDVDLTFRLDGPDHIMDRHIVNAQVGANGVAVWDRATGRGIRWLTPVRPAVAGRRATVSDQGLTWYYDTRKSGIKHSAVVAVAQGPRTYTFPYQLIGGGTALAVDADGNLLGDGFQVPRAYAVGADGLVYLCGKWRKLSGPRVAFDFDDSAVPLPYVLDPSSTFNVAATGDDAQVSGLRAGTYPPTAGSTLTTNGTNYYCYKTLSGGTFYIDVMFTQWDTSSLSGQTVTDATFRGFVNAIASPDARDMTIEWYAGSNWPIDTGDWTNVVGTDAHAGTTITTLTDDADNDFALVNLENVNTGGYTGLRNHVSGGEPTGTNYAQFAAWDHATQTEPRLLVTYSAAASGAKHRPMRMGFKW